MRDELRNDRDAKLRAALRAGDPAAEGRLAPEEVWALQRAALNAAERAGPRGWFPAVALAAGAAVFAAAVALWIVQVGTEEPPAPRIAARAASPRGTAAPTNPSPGAPEPLLSTPDAPAAEPPARRVRVQAPAPRQLEPPPPLAAAPTILPTQPVLADAAPEPRPLQIQFATPGGTRIIWMLAEESES